MISLVFFVCAAILASDPNSIVAALEFGEVATCPEVPTLRCKNGSTCTPGIASFGKMHDGLNLQTHDSGYHCKCQSGYIGHECEILAVECSGNEKSSVCYNGSRCDGSGKCDCKALNQDSESTDTKYEGESCQYESTSFCVAALVGSHAPDYQFCTNHGVCVRLVAEGESHPGCVCKDGWSGNHCEIRGDPFEMQSSKATGEGKKANVSTALFSTLVVLIAIVTLGVIYALIKIRRRRNESITTVVFSTSTTKTVVGEGDLDADGSGTLGSPKKVEDVTDKNDGDDFSIDDNEDDEVINGLRLAEVV
jgi:hypothetical protein